jgi:hypothetical protein
MSLLELSSRPPDLPFVWEDVDEVRSNRPTRLEMTSRAGALRIVHPSLHPLVLLDVNMQRRLDDRPTRHRTSLAFTPLRLLQPSLPIHHDLLIPQLAHSRRHDALDLCRVAGLLGESSGGDPDLVRGRDGLSGFVENLLGGLGGFESGEGEPEVDGGRNEFDSSSEEDSSVGWVGFEVDGLFPEGDGVWDSFEGWKGPRG